MKRETISRLPGPQWAPRWPWSDRGRSILTREQIAAQSAEALRMYARSFPH